MYTLKQLEAFCATAACGSFTEASKRLILTQSTIAKRVGELESSVGAPSAEKQRILGLNRSEAFTMEPARHCLLLIFLQVRHARPRPAAVERMLSSSTAISKIRPRTTYW